MNRNANVNVNRNVNVNVHHDVDVHHDDHYDAWGHPVAATVAVAATAVAIGTMVAALPPRCSTAVVGAVTYHECGGVYYQPVYRGSTVRYVVVNAP